MGHQVCAVSYFQEKKIGGIIAVRLDSNGHRHDGISFNKESLCKSNFPVKILIVRK